MKKTKGIPRDENNTKDKVLHLAFELGHSKWRLVSSDGDKIRSEGVAARNLEQLQEEVQRAKVRFKLRGDVRIVSCYEAGRDGFWLHRYLLSCGIENLVVDSSSIEVNRRKRRAKTDRIDARKLLNMLIRHQAGERRHWSVVNVPSVGAEEGRHLHREMEGLKLERNMHRNRIKSILIQQGIAFSNPSSRNFLIELDSFRSWDGGELPKDFKARIVREHERLRMVEEQIHLLNKERQRRIQSGDKLSYRQVAQLMSLRGIGMQSSWKFVMEFFFGETLRTEGRWGLFQGSLRPLMIVGQVDANKGLARRAINVFELWLLR